MKQSEIIHLSKIELQNKLSVLKKDYFDLKMNHAVSPLENPVQLRTMRRIIARVATELIKKQKQVV